MYLFRITGQVVVQKSVSAVKQQLRVWNNTANHDWCLRTIKVKLGVLCSYVVF